MESILIFQFCYVDTNIYVFLYMYEAPLYVLQRVSVVLLLIGVERILIYIPLL